MLEKLNIGILTSPVITAPTTADRVPPGWSGAPENVMLTIADGMADEGHHVVLFATGETTTRADLEYVHMKSSYEDPSVGLQGNRAHESELIAHCYGFSERGAFDLVNSRFLTEGRHHVMRSRVPTVVTLHTPLSREANQDQIPLIKGVQSHVFISQAQRLGHEDFRTIPGAEVIYHGIDLHEFPFNPEGGNHLTMVGRMRPQKGPHIAVEAAQRLDVPLKLFGSFSQNPANAPYLESVMDLIAKKPDVITLGGFVDHSQTAGCFAFAKASLYPIQWPEPFGMSAGESMASGTPPIATALGSMSELIVDGETGYLVPPEEGIDGFTKAINKLYSLKPDEYREMRRKCRERAEHLFSQEKMIQNYEKAYYTVTGKI